MIPKKFEYNPVRRDEVSPWIVNTGNTKGGSITVPLTSCLTGLD
jgi:hypothetical protein